MYPPLYGSQQILNRAGEWCALRRVPIISDLGSFDRWSVLHISLNPKVVSMIIEGRKGSKESRFRPISTGKLRTLLHFHTQPINLVVYQGSSDLTMGDLFLRQASRLDAFSGYPFRTWLPSAAPGGTTGTLVVRPSRSSRTRDRPSQISYAHSR